MVRNMKWGAMRDVAGVMHNVADKYGIAKWNSVLRLRGAGVKCVIQREMERRGL